MLRFYCVVTQAIQGELQRSIALQRTSAHQYQSISVAPDGAHFAVSQSNTSVSVYSLPDARFVRRLQFSSRSPEFTHATKVCFSATGTLLVPDNDSKRIHEVTMTGEHVRYIGGRVIDSAVSAITATVEVVVIVTCGTAGKDSRRVMVFDAATGSLVKAFGDSGDEPGQLMKYCDGVRITPINRHIIVTECDGDGRGRLSVFTLRGQFVKCIGQSQLQDPRDVEFADNVEIITCDGETFFVYSGDGETLRRQWDTPDVPSDGETCRAPASLAMLGGQLFVLDRDSSRMQIFT